MGEQSVSDAARRARCGDQLDRRGLSSAAVVWWDASMTSQNFLSALTDAYRSSASAAGISAATADVKSGYIPIWAYMVLSMT